ncbi:MAG: tRNA (5-methylaminomethyl-2-thiouridine)(34)-methyltransferase MnmD [Rubripirellula sp.]
MRPTRETFSIPDSPWVVQITDDGSRTLVNPTTGIAFHSASGAATETRHVYLNNSGVSDRLNAGQETSVLEIGLGTGMGLLMTVDLAMQSSAKLTYFAVENQWLESELLNELHLPDLVMNKSTAQEFLRWRSSLGARVADGLHSWKIDDQRQVTVYHDNALTLDACIDKDQKFDAIYFDPFAPSANSHLWEQEFLSTMGQRLKLNGRLVTYCVNRVVRESFASAGFDVRRVAGPPGGKREVMIATCRT